MRMLGEMTKNWTLEKAGFEKEEKEKLEKAIYEVISECYIGQHIIYGEYDDMTEYFSICVKKFVNEYRTPIYELIIYSGNYDNIKADCNCEYCTDDCPLYNLNESERMEYFEREVNDWLNKPKKETKSIDTIITIKPDIIEIDNAVIGVFKLKAITTRLNKLISIITLCDELLSMVIA